jgi:hypothetical protein
MAKSIKLTIFAAWLLGCVGIMTFFPAQADISQPGLPDVGRRTYVLGDEEPFKPTVIVGDDKREEQIKVESRILRDPARPGSPDKVAPPMIRKKAKQPVVARSTPAAQPREMPGQLRFKRMAVTGSLVQPRVQFSRRTLTVGRTDEPTRRDFIERVREAADR